MPLVLVARDPELVSDEILEKLALELPTSVALHLSVEGTEAELNLTEIEVRFFDFGKFDVCNQPLEIVIFANDYPERRKGLKVRVCSIRNGLRNLIPDLPNFWVWVRLTPGEFAESVRRGGSTGIESEVEDSNTSPGT